MNNFRKIYFFLFHSHYAQCWLSKWSAVWRVSSIYESGELFLYFFIWSFSFSFNMSWLLMFFISSFQILHFQSKSYSSEMPDISNLHMRDVLTKAFNAKGSPHQVVSLLEALMLSVSSIFSLVDVHVFFLFF